MTNDDSSTEIVLEDIVICHMSGDAKGRMSVKEGDVEVSFPLQQSGEESLDRVYGMQ